MIVDYVHVYKPEISINTSYLNLPNVYIKPESYYDFISQDEVVKYLNKEYSKSQIRQILIDAIENGDIEFNIRIADSDAYDIDTVDNDDVLELDEFKNIIK